MATYLVLDKNNAPLNMIEWDGEHDFTLPDGQRMIRYDGAFHPDGHWHEPSQTLIDPNPEVLTKPTVICGVKTV